MSAIETLKAFFKMVPTPERAKSTVEQLEANLNAAIAHEAKCAAEVASLNLAVYEEVSGAKDALLKAKKAHQSARDEVETARATLEGGKTRYAEALKAREQEEVSLNWERCEKVLVPAREKLGLDIEAIADTLVQKLDELSQLSTELHKISPYRVDLTASVLAGTSLSNALRQHLWKRGAHWAYRGGLYGVTTIPVFSEKVREGNALILSRHPKNLEQSSSEEK